ncbi:hypothetical protein KR038_002456, partial [Drosophila bunnanda]
QFSPNRSFQIIGRVEFSNLKCVSWDPEWIDFEYCYLKAFNRSFKYLSLKAKLYKLPVNEMKVNFELFKRYSGYKPFLYNISVDACKVVKNPKAHPIFAFFYSLFSRYSNMNHSCPYKEDVLLDRLPIEHVNNQFTKVLPFPPGDYLFHSKWMADEINRAEVDVYATLI